MKIDKTSALVNFTRDQAYFSGCWFNMIHEHSVDSHRVRVVNPQNCLRELEKIHSLGNQEDRAMVREEALLILEGDPTLARDTFSSIRDRLCRTLKDKAFEKEKEGGPATTMMRYMISELRHTMENKYVFECLDSLEEILVNLSLAGKSEVERFRTISGVTNNLLSVLIDSGSSLEALFAVYSQYLVSYPANGPPPAFTHRLERVRTTITQAEREFQVVFTLDNVTSPKDFPSEIGGIQFSPNAQLVVDNTATDRKSRLVRNYLAVNRSRLFASQLIHAPDARAAGSLALTRLNDVLNLVRFEYERARVSLPDAFASKTGNAAPRFFSLPNVVPNPTTGMDGIALSEFVTSVDELVSSSPFQLEGRDRINSAFRLYRTGLDTNVLENKLMNWWTALEFLVRGNLSAGNIGSSVESLVTPVLCCAYIPKHLITYRNVLVELGAKITDPVSNETIQLKSLNTSSLFSFFRRPDIQTIILDSVKDYPFLESHIAAFLKNLLDPKLIKTLNEGHERRVRWQLQRIWRARCDIVHSADRRVSPTLLCANLEYYLKATLVALLKDIRTIPTLSGPKEFFDRQALSYSHLQESLASGKDDVLVELMK